MNATTKIFGRYEVKIRGKQIGRKKTNKKKNVTTPFSQS